MLLWDCFVLEHKLANGRTVVEQFVAANPRLSETELEMLLGWQDVVQGPFDVLRRDGPALVVQGLVDELTYRVRSNMGRPSSDERRVGRSSSPASSQSATSGCCPGRSTCCARQIGILRTGWRWIWRCGRGAVSSDHEAERLRSVAVEAVECGGCCCVCG
jgi:hypothetical protein